MTVGQVAAVGDEIYIYIYMYEYVYRYSYIPFVLEFSDHCSGSIKTYISQAHVFYDVIIIF